jgi:type II secretory pathway component GspD/PulD (secretin)
VEVRGKTPRIVGHLASSPWADASFSGLPQGGGQKAGKGSKGAKSSPTQEPGQGNDALEVRVGDEELYSRFGSRIWIHPDGRVTKPFYVNSETGQVLTRLLQLANATRQSPPKKGEPTTYQIKKNRKGGAKSLIDSLLGGYDIEIHMIPGFDSVVSLPLPSKSFNGSIPKIPGPQIQNDLLLVTARPDGLEAFEETMNLFYASVPQILIEVKVVEVSHGDTLDLGVSQTSSKIPTLKTRGKGGFLKQIISKFPNSSITASGAAAGPSSEGLITIGGIHDNFDLNAQLELLQTQAKADIVSHPRIAVRNGGMAVINTTTQIPYPQAQIIGNNTKTSIKFANVGVTLAIRPVVTPGDMVYLQIQADVSAVTGFSNTDPIPTPNISTRRATTQVLLPSGKSTAIGGLITRNHFENVSKLPILGDIPILGYLFRSTFTQNSYNEVIFMIHPKVIYGFEGDLEGLEGDDFLGGGY